MRAFRNLSIRYKLTLMSLGVASLVLLIESLAHVVSDVQTTRAAMASKYSTLAKIVAAQSGAALSIADVDPSGARQIISELAAEPAIRYAALFNAENAKVVEYSADASTKQPPPLPESPGAVFTDDGFLDVAELVELHDGSVIGSIYVRAATTAVQRQIRRTLVIAAAVYLIAVAMALLISMAMQRLISVPILQFAQLTQRVTAEHNYDLSAEYSGNDEFGIFCDQFNEMLAEIRRRDQLLADHRARLEHEVSERTEVLRARTDELLRANEELMQSREALQAANKELEAFSYSVSHDLRSPLRAIDGFSRILIDECSPILPPNAMEYLNDVRANARKMDQLISDLLKFARLSRQPIAAETVATPDIVQQCLAELEQERRGRSIDLQIRELPPCLGDPSLLKQVWMNLISNAVKYTARREQAVIEIGSLRADEPGKITYFVKDNGAGFDMRYVNKLFGVFQRLHASEDYVGTGVGLAIVQRIVRRHGGEVWAEAELDKGAAFFFKLDADSAEKSGPSTALPPVYAPSRTAVDLCPTS